MKLPRGPYSVIYADPAWDFRARSAKGMGRSAQRHYDCMSLEDICALPVARAAADDAVLLIWTTGPFLEKTFEVIRAWGFAYKTVAFNWMKENRNGGLFIGMGYWTRSNGEWCLLATRGSPRRRSAKVPQAVLEPVREHSRKPDCVYARIEELLAGPYLELFARTRRRGWDCWGNQAGKFGVAA